MGHVESGRLVRSSLDQLVVSISWDKKQLNSLIMSEEKKQPVDWSAVTAKLPSKKANEPGGEEQKAQRKKMFSEFDPNGNGVLSLAEVEKGIRDVIQIDNIFDAKPAIMRAFQIAKNCTKSSRTSGDDYIEFKEFRYFCYRYGNISNIGKRLHVWMIMTTEGST